MVVLDIVIVILFIVSFLEGWKKGLLTSLVKLLSSILIFILAFLLKGPISLIFIEHLPFISFGGIFAGITSINVILYEGLAFLLCIIILSIIFKILLKFTGVINKLLNATIILGLPNKLGGAIINFLRYYIIAFIIVFIISLIPKTSKYVLEANLSNNMLNKTPILSSVTKDLNHSLAEIYELVKEIDKNTDKEEINAETLKILLKYDIISKDTTKILHEQGKLDIDDIDSLMNAQEEE